MQRLEVSGAVRPIYGSLGVKRLIGEAKFPIHTKQCSVKFLYILLFMFLDSNETL